MKSVRSVFLSLGLVAGGSAGAERAAILHEPLSCWPSNRFLLVESGFETPADIQTVKLYFRSVSEPDYYYVEMTVGRGGSGRLILPKAEASTGEVAYYLELVTRSFSAFRSGERRVPVTSGGECGARGTESTFYRGPNPDITVGAVRPGAPPLPPGFQAEGVSSFVNAWGSLGQAASGGGSSGKTLALIGGIGGGAAAAAFAAGATSGASPGGSGPLTGTTTVPLTTSVTSGGISSTTSTAAGASGTTTNPTNPTSSTTSTASGPAPTTSTPTTSTTTSIGSSTTTSGGSTTTRPSTTTQPSTTTSSGPSSSTTSAPTTTTSVSTTTAAPSSTTTAGGSTSDLGVTKSASPNPARVGQDLQYTVTVTNLGPAKATGVLVDDTLPSSVLLISINNPNCALAGPTRVICNLGELASGAGQTLIVTVRPNSTGTITNRVTVDAVQVDPNPANDTASVTTGVNPFTTIPSGEVQVTYKSSLSAEPEGRPVRGRVVLNDAAAQETEGPGEFVYTAPARSGVNHIEAQIFLDPASSGVWRFDFGASPAFVPGSLQVESGHVVSLDSRSIAFSVGRGAPGPRFRFELEDRARPSPWSSRKHRIFRWTHRAAPLTKTGPLLAFSSSDLVTLSPPSGNACSLNGI